MDAIFGLPRKKSAGKSFRQPLHGGLFFENQNEVDEFVEAAPVSLRGLKCCQKTTAN